MALVWRLTRSEFADDLSGDGAAIAGGRWNSIGHKVVYSGENLSLCVLETYVHFPPAQRANIPQFDAIRIRVPEDTEVLRISLVELEHLLSSPDPQSACRDVGDRWLNDGAHLLLVAPSVVVPEEENVMINPAHPRMKDVTIVHRRRFRFDPRLRVR